MIRFEGFGKRFGAHAAVEDVSFSIERGEAVALLGPNGSGKTTTLKAAAGLVRPTSGRVLVGNPPADASTPAARASISFLPQRVSFPESLTGAEVVEFYRRLRRSSLERAKEVLRMASLNGASARPLSTYSGGMVQRLGLAVAALPDAPVLLLDEPTAALDPEGLCAFYGLVDRRRRDGRTLLFSSHQLGDVERLADRFLLLIGGRLAASLSRRELTERLSKRGVLRLSLEAAPADLLAAVRRVAPSATWSGDELVIPGPAAERPRALDAVREAGGRIVNLVAEEARLDSLYRELVASAENGAVS
ncbi:MAG TPA: ABC transporter ATP-binding protein [Thermoanaerobaculia bacterium]|nr:ABC transporter ATP-binding protein [Thermoanaerobaculia bacterium]